MTHTKFKEVAISLLIIAGLFTRQASAELWEWSGWQRIITLYPANDGLVILVSGTISSGSSCPNRLIISTDDSNYQVKAAALMAAFFADKEVNFYLEQGSTTCGSPINRFQVRS